MSINIYTSFSSCLCKNMSNTHRPKKLTLSKSDTSHPYLIQKKNVQTFGQASRWWTLLIGVVDSCPSTTFDLSPTHQFPFVHGHFKKTTSVKCFQTLTKVQVYGSMWNPVLFPGSCFDHHMISSRAKTGLRKAMEVFGVLNLVLEVEFSRIWKWGRMMGRQGSLRFAWWDFYFGSSLQRSVPGR